MVRFDSHSYNLPEKSGRKAGAVSRGPNFLAECMALGVVVR
jgi:hypothetical protein